MKKIYSFLKATFFYKGHNYIIHEDKQTVLKKMNALFEKEFSYFIDRGNSYVGEYDFKLLPNNSGWYWRWFERRLVYVKGSIESDKDDVTIIILKIRPNSYFFATFIVFLLAGIAQVIKSVVTNDITWIFPGVILLMVMAPLLIWTTRNITLAFLEKFEKYMDIKSHPA